MKLIGNMLKAIIAVAMIVAVLFAGVFIYKWASAQVSFGSPKVQQTAPVVFVIKPLETAGQVADNLEKAGIIDSAWQFKLKLQWTGAGQRLQAGSYTLTPGADWDALITTLTTSHAIATQKITVIEGLRLEQIAENLGAQKAVNPDNFLKLTTTPQGVAVYSDTFTFLATAGLPAGTSLEGFLFPDTYDVKKTGDDSSDAVIKTMLQGMEDKVGPMLADVPKQQIDGKPANLYQVLTLASIVQREGVVQDELPDIAQVYWNRLAGKLGPGVPEYLNADPTIQYAVGKPGKWWPVLTLDDLKIDSPYNSNTHAGLPPGPIAAPGLAAINATIHPSQGNYLFFVAKCDGSSRHYFAKTLDEQTRNQAKCKQ